MAIEFEISSHLQSSARDPRNPHPHGGAQAVISEWQLRRWLAEVRAIKAVQEVEDEIPPPCPV